MALKKKSKSPSKSSKAKKFSLKKALLLIYSSLFLIALALVAHYKNTRSVAQAAIECSCNIQLSGTSTRSVGTLVPFKITSASTSGACGSLTVKYSSTNTEVVQMQAPTNFSLANYQTDIAYGKANISGYSDINADVTASNGLPACRATARVTVVSSISPTPTPKPNIPTRTPTPTLRLTPTPVPSLTSYIYTDSLSSGWENWSWGGKVDFANYDYASKAILFTPTVAPNPGLYLHTSKVLNTTGYNYLRFSIRTVDAVETIRVFAYDSAGKTLNSGEMVNNWGVTPANYKFYDYKIPLSVLNATNKSVSGFSWQILENTVKPSVYFDNINISN